MRVQRKSEEWERYSVLVWNHANLSRQHSAALRSECALQTQWQPRPYQLFICFSSSWVAHIMSQKTLLCLKSHALLHGTLCLLLSPSRRRQGGEEFGWRCRPLNVKLPRHWKSTLSVFCNTNQRVAMQSSYMHHWSSHPLKQPPPPPTKCRWVIIFNRKLKPI